LKLTSHSTILALDVGSVRIGVARAHAIARIAEPLTTLRMSDTVFKDITALIEEHRSGELVVGLPRNLSGEDTDQTRMVREFTDKLRAHVHIPIIFQDEALTSKKAEQELKAMKRRANVPSVDELAAAYILDDYLTTHPLNQERFA
jgi:putative holliday junction resolvase